MRTPRTRPPANKVTQTPSASGRTRTAAKTAATGEVIHTPSASGRTRTAAKTRATGKVSQITRRITREISADRRAAMRELANR